MNLNDRRTDLKTAIDIIVSGTWDVTTATLPDLNATLTVQIGHAAPTPTAFKDRRVELPVTLWANEGNDADAQANLYAQLSGPDSIVDRLRANKDLVRSVTVDAVEGRRLDGPTLFLAADLTVVVRLPTEGA